MDGRRILIFSETKRGCDAVTRQLRQDGWPALSIHGDKSQQERDWVLAEFKSGKHPIMTATDVAARGLGGYLGVQRWQQGLGGGLGRAAACTGRPAGLAASRGAAGWSGCAAAAGANRPSASQRGSVRSVWGWWASWQPEA